MKNRYISISRETVHKFMILTATTFLAVLVIVLLNNPWYHLIAVWTVVGVAILLAKVDILHPYCWFSAVFGLYNTSYTILYCMERQTAAGYNYQSSLYTLMALYIVLVIVGPKTEKKTDFPRQNIDIKPNNTKVWLYGFSVIVVLFSLLLVTEGYSGKTAMKQANDIYYRLGVHFVRWMIIFMLIALFGYILKDRKNTIRILIAGGVPSILFCLCTGERDVLFRYLLVLIIFLFVVGIIKRRHVFVLIPIGIIVMLGSVYFKYALLGRGVNLRYFSGSSLIEEVLSTDFLMAGRNFQWLLFFSWTKGYFGLSLMLSELFNGLIPGVEWVSVTKWFQTSVYPAGFKNVAFTLIGTGYVMSGVLGIIIIFVIVGFLIRFFYRSSNKNIYTMSFYIYSITLFCGASRSNLNNLLMQIIKGILIAYLLHKYICRPMSIKQKKRK